MLEQPRSERRTQNRVIALFTDKELPIASATINSRRVEQANNGYIEAEFLRANLKRRRYSEAHISAALQELMAAADATGVTQTASSRSQRPHVTGWRSFAHNGKGSLLCCPTRSL